MVATRMRRFFGRMEFLESITIWVPLTVTLCFEAWLLYKGAYWYRPRLAELFTAYFGVVGILSAILAHATMGELQKRVRHLVEMSLRPLRTFPEVLEKARNLVERAEGELYFVSFVVGFGALHCGNSEIVDRYKRSAEFGGLTTDYKEAVEEFFEIFLARCAHLPKVIIVLLQENRLRAVLEGLKTRPGYANLEVEAAIKDETDRRRRLAYALAGRRQGKEGEWKLAPVLPEQILIARMRNAVGDEIYGCMVFLVGSETATLGRPVGYYIEAREVASIYMAFVEEFVRESPVPFQDLRDVLGDLSPPSKAVQNAKTAEKPKKVRKGSPNP